MSFIRHKKIYRHDVQGEAEHRSSFPSDHRCDESSAGYSFVGCSPAAPTSASPAVPSFSLYSAAVQFSAANRNCPSIALSQPRGPLQTKSTPSFGTIRDWLSFAKGYESTEPDHAEAGGYSLVAAETRTGSQACAERGSKGDNEEVGSGVQGDRHGA